MRPVVEQSCSNRKVLSLTHEANASGVPVVSAGTPCSRCSEHEGRDACYCQPHSSPAQRAPPQPRQGAQQRIGCPSALLCALSSAWPECVEPLVSCSPGRILELNTGSGAAGPNSQAQGRALICRSHDGEEAQEDRIDEAPGHAGPPARRSYCRLSANGHACAAKCRPAAGANRAPHRSAEHQVRSPGEHEARQEATAMTHALDTVATSESLQRWRGSVRQVTRWIRLNMPQRQMKGHLYGRISRQHLCIQHLNRQDQGFPVPCWGLNAIRPNIVKSRVVRSHQSLTRPAHLPPSSAVHGRAVLPLCHAPSIAVTSDASNELIVTPTRPQNIRHGLRIESAACKASARQGGPAGCGVTGQHPSAGAACPPVRGDLQATPIPTTDLESLAQPVRVPESRCSRCRSAQSLCIDNSPDCSRPRSRQRIC